MQESGTAKIDWVFWVQWVLVSALGWIVGWSFLGEFSIGLSVDAFQ